jgi:hypothetical protein
MLTPIVNAAADAAKGTAARAAIIANVLFARGWEENRAGRDTALNALLEDLGMETVNTGYRGRNTFEVAHDAAKAAGFSGEYTLSLVKEWQARAAID